MSDPGAADGSLLLRRVVWIILAGAWVFGAASLLSFDSADPPSAVVAPHNETISNWCGRFGAVVAWHAYESFGLAVWVFLVLCGLALWVGARGERVTHLWVRVIGALLLTGGVAGLLGLVLPDGGPIRGLGGGLVGTVAAAELVTRFNPLGAFLWLSAVVMIGAVVALDVWAIRSVVWIGRGVWWVAHRVGALAGRAASVPLRRGAAVRLNDVDDDESVPGREGLAAARAQDGRRRGRRDEEEPDADESASEEAEEDEQEWEEEEEAPEEEEEDLPGAPQVFDPDALRAKIQRLPVRFAAMSSRSATEADLRDIQNVVELAGYKFPGVDLLVEPEPNFSQEMESFVREQAEALERALKEYRINGEVVGIDSGPVITLYEVRLAPGTKVSQLQAISSDLARALKAVNIRIVPNTAGRDTVGVEVPNAKKEKVRLKELMAGFESGETERMHLPMFLGKDASGVPLIEDLTTMPHLLIAGTTGSGKSVCMNTIIMSFLYTKKPNELKLVLVDPKMVELSQFKSIPHLMCPVVTEMGRAAAILEWAVGKMEERYELLAEAGCRDIASYNAMSWEDLRDAFDPATEEEEARIPRKLPYMVFVIDELADLMMTNKEVEHSIVRLAQKARAVGIHLIVATQRPQANVVTGLIKSNMPARISFKVASGMDSRIVLDQKGGELLLGQGDMLYLSPRSHKLIRAQGTLVDDREIRRVVRFMRDIASPTFERQLVQLRSGGEEGGDPHRDGFVNAQEDPLFDKAVEIVLETKRGSVSMLQRRLAIGYTRAARLIEMMGEAGILGTHKGTVARDVTMTLEEWRAIKAQWAADAATGVGDAAGARGQGELFPGRELPIPGEEIDGAEDADGEDEQWEEDEGDESDGYEDEDEAGGEDEEWEYVDEEDGEEEYEEDEEEEDEDSRSTGARG